MEKHRSRIIDVHKRFKWKIQNYQIDFQVSAKKVAFLHAMLNKDKNNNIQTTLYCKPTDQQALSSGKSEHPRPLKSSIRYSQSLRLKAVWSKSTELDKKCPIIRQKFLDRQYKEDFLDEQIKKVDTIKRKELFTCKEKNSNKKRIPLSITHNRTPPNISKIGDRNWNIFQINTDFHQVFQDTPMMAFTRSKNLQDIIGGHTVQGNKETFLTKTWPD